MKPLPLTALQEIQARIASGGRLGGAEALEVLDAAVYYASSWTRRRAQNSGAQARLRGRTWLREIVERFGAESTQAAWALNRLEAETPEALAELKEWWAGQRRGGAPEPAHRDAPP